MSTGSVDQFSQELSPEREANALERVKYFTYFGEEILLVDFSNLDASSIKAVAQHCRATVSVKPHGSIRTLVDVTGCWFDKETIQIGSDLASFNRPYVIRSAVLGVKGLRQFAFNAINSLSGRQMRVFDKREDALGWLIQSS